MEIEYEATFPDIGKEEIRERLRKSGAKLVKPEFLQKRTVFNLPKGHEIKGGWLRVRDEKDRITMTLKVVDGRNIENQKEITLEVNNQQKAEELLSAVGCEKKAYQETKRELWMLGNTEITIDEWPFLEPFLEVEGKSEKEAKDTCEKLELDYKKALFCSVDTLYSMKYNIPENVFNNHHPRVVFGEENPFNKYEK